MKRLIIFFVILLVAAIIGLLMHADPGYVLITYQSWSIETTLWLLLIAIFLLFLILHLLINLWRGTGRISKNIKTWMQHRRIYKARRQTNLGLCEWAEGKWQAAEKHLAKAAKYSEAPLINYLIAARTANNQGEYDKRDGYLRRAHASTPNVEIAVGLTQAQLQLEAKQLELALATLQHLNQLAAKHTHVMQLLCQVYLELNDWEHLYQLLPKLDKYKIFSKDEFKNLQQKVYLQLLTISNKFWQQIPRDLQNNPEILLTHCKELIKHKETNLAEQLIRKSLNKIWDSKLITIYGTITSNNPAKQIINAESWLKRHNNDADLLLCLGRLCKQQRLWGNAQNYLQAAIKIRPSVAAYRELAQIMEITGNNTAALEYYHQELSTQEHKK